MQQNNNSSTTPEDKKSYQPIIDFICKNKFLCKVLKWFQKHFTLVNLSILVATIGTIILIRFLFYT